jgi:hypothetical protein
MTEQSHSNYNYSTCNIELTDKANERKGIVPTIKNICTVKSAEDSSLFKKSKSSDTKNAPIILISVDPTPKKHHLNGT